MFNILVVEDDPVQRRLMKAVLTRVGYNVFHGGARRFGVPKT